MKRLSKFFWIVILLLTGLVLEHCGHKKQSEQVITGPELAPAVPMSWTGEEDWTENALSVQDIAP